MVRGPDADFNLSRSSPKVKEKKCTSWNTRNINKWVGYPGKNLFKMRFIFSIQIALTIRLVANGFLQAPSKKSIRESNTSLKSIGRWNREEQWPYKVSWPRVC